jgi:hypothetical protein
VSVAGSKLRAKEDATYFIAWIDQLISATQSNTDWNTNSEKMTVLDQLSQARKVYEKLLE